MQSCNELSEFKDKIGNLNEKCANALIKNKYLMRKVFYDEMKEIVRVNTANRILEKESGCATALDLASMVSEIEINCNIKISMDESNRKLIDSWKQLEDIEVYENAEVPSQYKNKMMESAVEDKERLKEKVADLEKNNESW